MTIEELELERQKVSKYFAFNLLLTIICVFLVLGVEVVFGYYSFSKLYKGMIFVGFFVLILFNYSRSFQEHEKFRQNYKTIVLNSIISKNIPNAIYSTKDYIQSNIYDESLLFNQHYNIYRGEDRIITPHFGNLSFSEIDVIEETGSGDDKKTTRIFKGIFGYATFPFVFDGTTVVNPKKSFFGNFRFGEEVKLESPRFMDIWSVRSTSQIGARLALGTDIMNNMLYFADHLKNDNLSLSFVGNKIYFAITKSFFLEPNWQIPITDQRTVSELNLEIATLLNIITSFKLHQNQKPGTNL